MRSRRGGKCVNKSAKDAKCQYQIPHVAGKVALPLLDENLPECGCRQRERFVGREVERKEFGKGIWESS